MTEKEKMLAGKLYDPSDKELSDLRIKAHKLSKMFNDDMGENGGFTTLNTASP